MAQCCFNTSHVVVYHGSTAQGCVPIRVSIHLMLQFIVRKNLKDFNAYLFQYISCCSLSILGKLQPLGFMSFNTSHVVVYPLKKGSVCWWWSFNTSHVVVYLAVCCSCLYIMIVSIHLMLQFIYAVSFDRISNARVSIHLMLQFISASDVRCRVKTFVSIHLMLQFIALLNFNHSGCSSVSIHLMLQFIDAPFSPL